MFINKILKRMLKKSYEIINLSNSELEQQKLIAEINSLNKPVWKLPSFWTFLIALIATIYSWQSGLFETKSNILELKTMQLDLKRDTLYNQIGILQKQKEEMNRKYDSLTAVVNNINTEYEKVKKTVQTWKQQKQSKSDLQKEVLAFVKGLWILVNEDKVKDEEAMTKYQKTKNWDEYTNSLIRNTLIKNYDANFKTKAIIYKEKLNYFLPNIELDRNTLFDYQYPTNRLGVENIINNLEYLAYKLKP